MPVLSASTINRRFRGSQEITRTYKGGVLIWEKPQQPSVPWIYPEIINSGSGTFSGIVTRNPDGSWRVEAAPGSTNGRCAFLLPPVGTVIEMETQMRFETSTRLLARAINSHSQTTGGTLYDVTRPSVGATLSRVDTFTVSTTFMSLIGVHTAGGYFTVLPMMRYWVLS